MIQLLATHDSDFELLGMDRILWHSSSPNRFGRFPCASLAGARGVGRWLAGDTWKLWRVVVRIAKAKCAICICASHPLAPRSLLPLHAVHHDLARAAVGTDNVVLLVPLEGDPSQLPTRAPHSATTTPKLGRFPKKFDFFCFRHCLRAIFCDPSVAAVPMGQKTAGKNGEAGPRNAAATAARSGQGGAAEGAAAGGRTVAVLPEPQQRTPFTQPLMAPPSIVAVAPPYTPRPVPPELVSVQPLSSARPLESQNTAS